MNFKFKETIKKIVPRFIINKISNTFQYYSFRGNFKNFNEINKNLTKYDSLKIINKVYNSYKFSKNYPNLIDRDGEVISKKNINFKLLNHICSAIKKNNCVIDFGGSLANFYRTNKLYLKKYNIKWIVIDNKKICDLGKKFLKNNDIYFFSDIKSTHKFTLENNLNTNLLLFGSSVQYLNDFEKILSRINKFKSENIIIDRQPVLRSKKTRCSIQKTPFWSGNFSYPVKLYNSRHLINILNKYNYYLSESFKAFGDQFKDGEYKTLIFKRKRKL